MLTGKVERVVIKYELDRMSASQRKFYRYRTFPIAKEGCNLMVRLMKEALMNAI